jgi:Fe2+ transport system protein B
MEMPLYHAPNRRTTGRFVWDHIQAFLRRAGSVILVFSILFWALVFPVLTWTRFTWRRLAVSWRPWRNC